VNDLWMKKDAREKAILEKRARSTDRGTTYNRAA
jgi:hypothetical protein